jgi:hypothetical protein
MLSPLFGDQEKKGLMIIDNLTRSKTKEKRKRKSKSKSDNSDSSKRSGR